MKTKLIALLISTVLLSACVSTTPVQNPPPKPDSVPPVSQSATPTPTESPSPSVTPTPEPTPTPAVATEEPVPTELPDASLELTMSNVFSWNPACYTYHSMVRTEQEALWTQLQSYKPLKDAVRDGAPVAPLGFLVIMNDKSKHSYSVTEEQLVDVLNNAVLDATPEECKRLYEVAKNGNATGKAFAQWLAYMSPQRITKLAFMGLDLKTTESIDFVTSDERFIGLMAQKLRILTVKPDSVKKSEGRMNMDTPAPLMDLELTFDSGVIYNINILRDSLYVYSSDMGYTLTYKLTSEDIGEGVRKTAKNIYDKLSPSTSSCDDKPTDANPMTGKPVIYLYPEKQTDVTVKLDFKGELWYTYPTLKDGGWNVTAYPDGRLVNKSDGTEHYYLFWDGNSNTMWQQDEGFCVAGKDTEAFLKQKLPLMGLTPREYNDFITFWVPRLISNPYNLITFAGAQYEELAPLTISPAPDSILRVHMVYKPLKEYRAIPEQTLTSFTRKGFTVVEWGGSIAK
ncbi:MAG: hypothetical protein RSD74_00715 [Angelakisella sp.]